MKKMITKLTHECKITCPSILKPSKILGIIVYKIQVFSLASIIYRVFFYTGLWGLLYVCIIDFCFYVYFVKMFFIYILLLAYFLLFVLFCYSRSERLLMYNPNYDKDNENKFAFPIFTLLFFIIYFIFLFNLENFFFYWFFDTFLFFDELDQPTFELSDEETIRMLYELNPHPANPYSPEHEEYLKSISEKT